MIRGGRCRSLSCKWSFTQCSSGETLSTDNIAFSDGWICSPTPASSQRSGLLVVLYQFAIAASPHQKPGVLTPLLPPRLTDAPPRHLTTHLSHQIRTRLCRPSRGDYLQGGWQVRERTQVTVPSPVPAETRPQGPPPTKRALQPRAGDARRGEAGRPAAGLSGPGPAAALPAALLTFPRRRREGRSGLSPPAVLPRPPHSGSPPGGRPAARRPLPARRHVRAPLPRREAGPLPCWQSSPS